MKFNCARCLAMQDFGHNLSVFGTNNHTVATANRSIGCYDQRIAITIKRQHGVA
ncbi:hypothetical protein D9M69_646100 [compost metagenome]